LLFFCEHEYGNWLKIYRLFSKSESNIPTGEFYRPTLLDKLQTVLTG
jgi:hypothetical protein